MTDTRIKRGRRSRSSKNNICFFYPPLPFHLSSCLSDPLLTAQAQATKAAEHFTPSTLPSFHRLFCECEQERHFDRRGRGFSLQRECAIAPFRPLPSWNSAAVGLGTPPRTAPLQAKQSDFKVRTVPRNPNRSISFPFAPPTFLLA